MHTSLLVQIDKSPILWGFLQFENFEGYNQLYDTLNILISILIESSICFRRTNFQSSGLPDQLFHPFKIKAKYHEWIYAYTLDSLHIRFTFIITSIILIDMTKLNLGCIEL